MGKTAERKIAKWGKTGKTIRFDYCGNPEVYTSVPDYVVGDVLENGCTMPRPKRVEYSFKKASGDKPAVLATVVFFDDGTKSVVKNCPGDLVETVEKKLSDGSTVETASDSSKEIGFVYAVVKRLLSSLDEDGNAVCSGLGNSLRETVANAVDQNVVAAEKQFAKKQLAEEKPNEKPAKKAKREKKTDLEELSSSLSRLTKLVEQLAVLKGEAGED